MVVRPIQSRLDKGVHNELQMEFIKTHVFDAVNGHYVDHAAHPGFDIFGLRDKLLAMVPPPPPPPPPPPGPARARSSAQPSS